ncbi:aldo/keto reductase, partial [Streptococcus hyovaginalis]
PQAFRDHWKEANAETWRAMEEVYEAGKVHAIGVSNFMQHHLDTLFEKAQVKPLVNQSFFAPVCPEDEMVAFCGQENIFLD